MSYLLTRIASVVARKLTECVVEGMSRDRIPYDSCFTLVRNTECTLTKEVFVVGWAGSLGEEAHTLTTLALGNFSITFCIHFFTDASITIGSCSTHLEEAKVSELRVQEQVCAKTGSYPG